MATPIFEGRIEEGKLKIKNAQLFRIHLGTLEGKEISIKVSRKRKVRSIKQNAYYWVVLTFIGNELGYEADDLHITFKNMFLIDHSKSLPVPKSTTKLNSLEFTEYLDKIIRKVGEMGITVPSPEDYYNNIQFQ